MTNKQQHITHAQLVDYIHNELDPQEDAFVLRHLDQCSDCQHAYTVETQLSEMLRNQARAEERELPSTVKAAIWQQIREAKPTPFGALAAWLRPAYALPIAALLIAGLFFTPMYLHHAAQNNAPSIEAAYYLQDHDAASTAIPFGDHVGSTQSDLQAPSAPVDQTAVIAVPVVYTADASR